LNKRQIGLVLPPMMNKLIITHLLLNLYLLVLIQPALPVLEYLINYDYIVNELCENRDKPVMACNGVCYLGDQVEKQLNLDHKDQVPLPPQIDYKEFIPLSDDTVSDKLVIITAPISRPCYIDFLKESSFSRAILRPPIV
jgi:hypothetical protein